MPSERTERLRAELRALLRSNAPAAQVEAWAERNDLTRRDLIEKLLFDGDLERARAERLADGLSGEAFSTDGVWLVRINRSDGTFVIIGDDINVFANERAFEDGDAEQTIALS